MRGSISNCNKGRQSNRQARIIKTTRTALKRKRCPIAVIKSTVARRTVMRTYWSPVSPDFVLPWSAMSAACLFKPRNCSCFALWYLWHGDRAGGRLRVVERIGPRPGCEGQSILVTKATLEELRRLLLAIQLGGKPTVEGITVVDPLLSCQGNKPFGSDSKPVRLG